MEKVTISIHHPCHEKWEQMTPNERGRYCDFCQKNVVDFTLLSDREIIRYLDEHKTTRICGRFFGQQLGRPLEGETSKPFYRTWVNRIGASLLLFPTFATTLWAQTVKPGTQQHASKLAKKDHKRGQLKGKVIDYMTREPLHNMQVQVTGTEITALTDKQGSFNIFLPDSLRGKPLQLYAFYASGSGGAPDSSIILPINVDSETQRICIYRYPQDFEPQVRIQGYKIPVINRDLKSIIENGPFDSFTGMVQTHVPITTVIIIDSISNEKMPKKSIWKKIGSIFRKKEDSNE